MDQLIGRTLVFGIPGTKVRAEDVRLFKETHAAGLILYRINFESPRRIKALIADLEGALERRLLVTVDHEGGRVVMFGGGVTVFPDNLAFGRAGTPRETARQGAVEGRELRRLGMDVNFAPTVDVLTDAYSPNIGIRSYGMDPRRVAALAAARIKAMQAAGVSACAKHFPGLGPATLDPHLELPVIAVGERELRRVHLLPFEAAIRAGVDVVMTSHPLYPKLDPARVPATFSRRIVTDLLRRELGFAGVISSDDLEMGALRHFGGAGTSAVRAAAAGHDLLLCCHRADRQREVFMRLREAYRDGTLPVKALEKSVERIALLRGKRATRFAGGEPRAEAAGERLAREMSRRAVTLQGPPASLPPAAPAGSAARERPRGGRGEILVIFPRLSDMAKSIMIEEGLLDGKKFVGRFLPRARALMVAVDPGAAEIRGALKAARRAKSVVFFCYEAHMFPGCRKLLDALQKNVPRLTVALMRTPYDRALIRPSVTTLTAFGARRCQLEACLEKLAP